ncbi:MAG: hypothetical protein M3R36_04290 [Bacteroidota bacterium]|nr:hypothetical protein [Bacteroidota bacterium]
MSVDKRRENPIKHKNDFLQLGMSPIKIKRADGKLKELIIPLPNFTALYLNISDKNFKIAEELYNERILNRLNEKNDYYELPFEDESVIYDFLEAVFSSIIFAFSAVECLINSLIPNYIIIVKKKSENKFELESKGKIEKFFTLEEKVKKILPKVYDYGFNANKIKCWGNFKKLISHRNELIHFKSNEFDGNKSSHTKFIGNLIVDVCTLNVIESAREIIKYLIKKIPYSPGFPKEFQVFNIDSEDYINHFKSKNITTKKEITFEFSNEISFNEFFNQTNLGKEREFKVNVR